MVATISDTEGIEDFLTHPKSITSAIFIEFLRRLADPIKGQRVILFLDNLRVHKSRALMQEYEPL